MADEYKERNVAGVGPVRFPSSMSDAEIDAVIEEKFPAQKTLGEEVQRKGEVAARALVSGAPLAVAGLPALVADAYDSLTNLVKLGYNELASPAMKKIFGADIGKSEYIPPFKSSGALMRAGEKLAELTPLQAPETPVERTMTSAIQAAEAALVGRPPANLMSRGVPVPAAPPVAPTLPQAAYQSAAQRLQSAAQASSAAPVATPIAAAAGGAGGQTAIERGYPELALPAAILTSTAPALAGKTVARAITPFDTALTPEQRRLLALGEQKYGFQFTPGQALGSRGLQAFEAQLENLGGASASPRAGQQEQFNRVISSAFGTNEGAITPDVLQRAQNDIGNTIGKIIDPHKLKFTPDFPKDVGDVSSEYFKTLNTTIRPAFEKIRDELLDLMKGRNFIKGPEIAAKREALLRQIKNATDPQYKEALNGLREAFDNEVEKSLPRAAAVELRDARNLYRTLKRVEEAMGAQTESEIAGVVNPSKILAATARENRSAATRGLTYPELREPALIAKALNIKAPDSGTATNIYMQRLTAGMPAILAATAAGAPAGFGPGALAAAAAGAGALAGPPLANKLYWNPYVQRYLRNQLLAGQRPRLPGAAMAPLARTTGGLLSE